MKNKKSNIGSFAAAKLQAKTLRILAVVAVIAVIGFSMTTCGSIGGEGGGSHWLISSQTTSQFIGGKESSSSNDYYKWISYRKSGETNYEEEYITHNGYYYQHNTRNGLTSTSESTSYDDRTTTYTTSTYDKESGLTLSIKTETLTAIAETSYIIQLIGDTNGEKVYRQRTYSYTVNHNQVGSKWGYTDYKIKKGEILEERSYSADDELISVTTYIKPDNKEISSKLPDFTLYNTYNVLSSSNSYQAVEVLLSGKRYFGIRVKTLADNTLVSQTDYNYFYQNPHGYYGSIDLTTLVGIKSSSDFFYTETWWEKDDENYDNISRGDGVGILGYKGNGGHVTIPSTINKIPVRMIFGAFQNCIKLTGVTIPDGVINLDDGAFERCINITSVTIPNSVTTIGQASFSRTGLPSITIPASVTRIGDSAFSGCTSLTSVTFQGTITANKFSTSSFDGDLIDKYLAGGPGTYTATTPEPNQWQSQPEPVWTKQ